MDGYGPCVPLDPSDLETKEKLIETAIWQFLLCCCAPIGSLGSVRPLESL